MEETKIELAKAIEQSEKLWTELKFYENSEEYLAAQKKQSELVHNWCLSENKKRALEALLEMQSAKSN